MREILFRGKKIYNGEWAYGFYVNSNGHLIHEGEYGSIWIADPNTIGQYTGLKDKNGNKIFEGDVLACKFHPRYVERISWKGKPDAICTVFYDFNGFRLKAKGEEDERYADFFDFLDNMEYKQQMHDLSLIHTEIIGNIHDKEVAND